MSPAPPPTRALRIATGSGSVTGLLDLPDGARCVLVLAHGAGAGIRHRFFEHLVPLLVQRGVATVRYQFPYMESGRRRPDPPVIAQATVRDAAAAAAQYAGSLPLLAGGKSFGGRMTSQAQAAAPLEAVRGLVFLGFPLHAAGKPDRRRGEHLQRVEVPMLFVQGTRDALAALDQLHPVVRSLGGRATLKIIDGGNHSFAVPKSTGRSVAEVLSEVADAVANWVEVVCGGDESVWRTPVRPSAP